MLDVREVLRRWQAGQSARRIAREAMVDRKTVGRYLEAAEDVGLDKTVELTDESVAAVVRHVQERPLLPPSDAWQALEGRRKQLQSWTDDGLRLVRVHELLKRDGVLVGYSTLRRFAQRELGWHKPTATVRIDDPPAGQEAQIDFGLMGMVTDADGRRRKLWVLLVTLSYSRHMFVWPTFTQTVEDVCEGLDAAWRFFGGIAKHVIMDNASSMIVRASATDPGVNRSFSEYVQARSFFMDPARVRKPKDKPRVENQVPFVRERWFAGESLSADLREVRRHAEAWCRDVAGARLHGTTRRVPRDVYETEERQHMLPAPTSTFDVPRWSTAKVHPDHHVQVAKALYSVPTRYIGKVLDVRADRSFIRLYLGADLVKMHRVVAPGRRSTDPTDYPSDKAPWALRDVDSVIRRARELGSQIGDFAQRLLGGPLPWIKMRQAYALLRLCDRYGHDRVNALCGRAIAFDVFDVPRIERMLNEAQKFEDDGATEGRVIPLPSRFARDPSSFSTRASHAGSQEGGES